MQECNDELLMTRENGILIGEELIRRERLVKKWHGEFPLTWLKPCGTTTTSWISLFFFDIISSKLRGLKLRLQGRGLKLRLQGRLLFTHISHNPRRTRTVRVLPMLPTSILQGKLLLSKLPLNSMLLSSNSLSQGSHC